MRLSTNSILALLLAGGTVFYGAFEARALMQGPIVEVRSPRVGTAYPDVLLAVEGSARNATRVRLNGRPIMLDMHGAFSETLVTPNGYGKVVIEAENRFGKTTREEVEFVGKPVASDESMSNE